MGEDNPSAVNLQPRQRALFKKLAEKDSGLANMYLGALHVMEQRTNPDRLPLAAHNCRELIEKMPRFVDLKAKPPVPLRVRVNQLGVSWGKACEKSECKSPEGWTGTIDPHLLKFLGAAAEFFEWRDAEMPSRTTETVNVLRQLDPAKRALPSEIERINASLWEAMRGFFNGVAHHGKTTDDAEFEKWLYSLEDFIIDRIAPRTFDDLAAIDAIIKG